jgi:2-polyprenyl-3-methyl-5-hydroxy-6-metoxy-1,4-benzoquinol methylase
VAKSEKYVKRRLRAAMSRATAQSDDKSKDAERRAIGRHWDRLYAQSPGELPWEIDYCPPELKSWPQHLAHGARVLDIGCGRGVHALRLASQGFKVTGIDISSAAIMGATENAQRHNIENVTFRVADILSFRSRFPFDFAFDYSVFHHIPKRLRGRYVRSVYEALKSGSRFGLVCYTNTDSKAQGRNVRVGSFGNTIYHPTREEVSSLFAKWFSVISYNETTLGRADKHPAHHFIFVKIEGAGC